MKEKLIYLATKLFMLLLFLSLFVSCMTNRDNDGPIVKIFVSKPEQGGLVRAQENEVVKYEDTANYRCLNREDFDKLINYCFNPKSDNQFEQARQSIRNLPLKYQDTAIRNVGHQFINTSLNMNESTKE